MFPTQRRYRDRLLEEFEAPLSSALRETAREALLYSPLSSINRIGELAEAESGPLDIGGFLRGEGLRGEPESPLIAAEEARTRVREEGLDLAIPDEGIRSAALDILIERKSDERRRRDILNRAPGGFVAGGSRFATALAASMLDPINIAVSFVPVVGSARYTTMLANAGSGLARAGVRARVGAIEGAAGAAIVEPLVIGATTQEQADYGWVDTFLNVTLGTALGGGLHVGAGGVSDALARGAPWQRARATERPGQRIDAMPPEVQAAVLRTAVAQAIDGRRIDVEPIIAFGRIGGAATGRMEPVMRQSEPEVLPLSRPEADQILVKFDHDIRRMQEAGEDVNAIMRTASREGAARAVQNQEIASLRQSIDEMQALASVPNEFALGLRRTSRAAPDEPVFEAGFSTLTRADRDARIAEMRDRSERLEAAASRGEVDASIAQAVDFGRGPRQAQGALNEQLGRLNTALTNAGLAAKQSFQPENYRNVDMEASFRADEQISDMRRGEEARIREEVAEAMEDLNGVADALGVDVQARMVDADALESTAEAYGNAVRAAVECRLRRGA